MIYTAYTEYHCSNGYIIEDDCGDCAVIDPGYEDSRSCHEALKLGERLKYILLTHRHCDHLLAAAAIRRATGARIVIHPLDAPGLYDTGASLFHEVAEPFNYRQEPAQPDFTVEDGDVIRIGSTEIRVMHTPGHSVGGVCYIADDVLFCGDTLLAGSMGRTDFDGGSIAYMAASLRKIAALGDDYTVCPGHGECSTLRRERETNPYMRMALDDTLHD